MRISTTAFRPAATAVRSLRHFRSDAPFLLTHLPLLALHFHLSVLHDSIKTPGGKNEYDDYDYVYDPHLDEDRDRQLMAVLPDFLRESDIDFSRHDALKFFTKIFDSTTKKVVMEGDEEGGREREAEGED